ncbi:hypothetical protein BKA69DRAFT_1045584 [Paraphysoderma sedebokerense]|nr:hypothetical protein BKA69DRAFT_1045584 [Paraphysoderma sedebokerense]
MSFDFANSNTPEQLRELDIQQNLPEDEAVVKDVLTDGQDITVECTTIPPPQDPVTEALLEEFKAIMIERWLYGNDTTFDYSQVDDDPTLDDLEQIGRDVQDSYFDEQEPSNMATGTGIQDF